MGKTIKDEVKEKLAGHIKEQLVGYVEDVGFIKTTKFLAKTSHIWADTEGIDILDLIEEMIEAKMIKSLEYKDMTPGSVPNRVKEVLYSKNYVLA